MLKEIELAGFKSIQKMKLAFNKINVLIGANGAGKSNFIELFKLLIAITNNRLQFYIRRNGGANALLHYGIKTSQQMTAQFSLETVQNINGYGFSLSHAPVNTLIIEENLNSAPTTQRKVGEESFFFDKLRTDSPIDEGIRKEITQYQVFHFHDTSDTAQMRGNCEINNNRILLNDGSNLAAILYKLQKIQPAYYKRIIKTIRQIAPFFDDFLLEPLTINPHEIQLRWRARESDYELGPHQLFDGTLRTMALITLLLQPEEDLPSHYIG
jgi:predicted ATPase